MNVENEGRLLDNTGTWTQATFHNSCLLVQCYSHSRTNGIAVVSRTATALSFRATLAMVHTAIIPCLSRVNGFNTSQRRAAMAIYSDLSEPVLLARSASPMVNSLISAPSPRSVRTRRAFLHSREGRLEIIFHPADTASSSHRLNDQDPSPGLTVNRNLSTTHSSYIRLAACIARACPGPAPPRRAS